MLYLKASRNLQRSLVEVIRVRVSGMFVIILLSIITIAPLIIGAGNHPSFLISRKSIQDFDRKSFSEKAVAISIKPGVTVFVNPDSSYIALYSLLTRANSTIDIMVYEFWSEDVYELLENAATRGVSIRVLLEGNVFGESGDKYNRWMAYKLYNLSQQGYSVDVRLDNDSYYMHAKVIIVDSKIVFVASENLVATAYPVDPENIPKEPYSTASRGWCAVIYNATVASIFQNVFNDEFYDAEKYDPDIHGRGKSPANYGIIHYSAPFENIYAYDSQAVVWAVFSPDNSTETLLSLINGADHFIFLELMYIYNTTSAVNQLLDALKSAHERGVTVQIILEDDVSYEIADELESLGFYVAPAFNNSDVPLFCHNKGVLVDDEYVLVGSINWSGNSLENNREAAILIRSKKIAEFYKEVFAWDWNKSSVMEFDSDGDGLSNAYEIDHELDPYDPDTDGDGLTDYEEVMIYLTDPKDPSSPGVVLEKPTNYTYFSVTNVTIKWRNSTNVLRYYLFLNGSLLDVLDGGITQYSVVLQDQRWYVLRFVAELSSGVNLTYVVYFAVDTKPPVITITHPRNDSYTLAGLITIAWDVSDFSKCIFEVFIDSELIIETEDTTISLNVSIGDYWITIKGVDKAGNIGEDRVLIHVREPPRVIIKSPINGTYTRNASIIVRWEVIGDYPIDEIWILLNGSRVLSLSPNTTEYLLEIISDGVYNITVACYSSGMLISRASAFFVRDTMPPVIEVLSPKNNSRLYAGQITIRWHVDDLSPVEFLLKIDGEIVYTGTGTSYTIQLEEGTHVIELFARDAAGNKSVVKIIITVEKNLLLEYLPIIAFVVLIALLIMIAIKKLTT